MKQEAKEILWQCLWLIVAAVVAALGLHIFVYPADFAPSGIDGVATMLYELTGFNAGYYNLIINLPLLVLAWFILKRKYVIYTITNTILVSLLLIVFEKIELYQYIPERGSLISPVFAGVLLGIRAGLMFKIGGSTGGVDVVACIISKKSSYPYIEKLVSLFCYTIIAISIFVYKDLTCILLAVVQTFVYEKMTAFVLRDCRNAIECRIITKHTNEIREELLYKLKHGATIVESKGMYTEEDNYMIFTVINIRQIAEFTNIIKKYSDTFIYYDEVTGLLSNFRFDKQNKREF